MHLHARKTVRREVFVRTAYSYIQESQGAQVGRWQLAAGFLSQLWLKKGKQLLNRLSTKSQKDQHSPCRTQHHCQSPFSRTLTVTSLLFTKLKPLWKLMWNQEDAKCLGESDRGDAELMSSFLLDPLAVTIWWLSMKRGSPYFDLYMYQTDTVLLSPSFKICLIHLEPGSMHFLSFLRALCWNEALL